MMKKRGAGKERGREKKRMDRSSSIAASLGTCEQRRVLVHS